MKMTTKTTIKATINVTVEHDGPEDTGLRQLAAAAKRLRRGRTALAAAVAASAASTQPLRSSQVANPIVQETIDEVTEAVTTMKSATALINGFKGMLADAVEQAVANGATADQLAPFTDLKTALDTEGKALAEAVLANTKAP